MLAIYKRELRSYFISPIGYIFCAIFIAVSAFAFCLTTLKAGTTDVTTYYTYLLFILVILAPLLTMRSFTEERKQRTEQLLLTSPVSIGGMVAAKYLASLTIFLGTMAVSSLNLLTLYIYSDEVQTGVILGNLFAVIIVGAAFLAIGTFMSALTENQLAAAVATMGVLVGLLAIAFFNSYIDIYWIREILNWISIFARYQTFCYGLFDFVAILYYASICFIFLFLTTRVFERRRWGS